MKVINPVRYLLPAALTVLLLGSIADASAPLPKGSSSGEITASPDSEFFQLSFPVATKPFLGINVRTVIYNAIVDHTPGFYCPSRGGTSTDLEIAPYTGERSSASGTCAPTTYSNPRPGRYYYYNGHPGLDINVIVGTPVYAAHAGVVVRANMTGDFNGYGLAVIIQDLDNFSFFTLYGHLSRVDVTAGYSGPSYLPPDKLGRGQRMGLSGSTGAGTGPHLHFGLYYSRYTETPPYVLDPYNWFAAPGVPDPLNSGSPSYKWASGFPADGNANEPNNFNMGTLIGNEYIHKDRMHQGPQTIGNPLTSSSTTIHPIEHAWANSYGSVGAPYSAAFASGDGFCQYFEGGTFCSHGPNYQNVTYGAHFQDVPLSFWANRYAGWANTEGVVTGYACGGVNEPCVPPNNLPYYRPANFISRQQFAKIMVLGFSLPIYNPPQPSFADINPNDPLYVYVESIHNVVIVESGERLMTGRECGQSLPCFAPTENIRRGQASKVAELTAEYKGWLCDPHDTGGQDFWDVVPNDPDIPFYTYTEKLYNAGILPYRQEEAGHAGQGGHYYIAYDATRAEIAQLLHDTVYAVSPPGSNGCSPPLKP